MNRSTYHRMTIACLLAFLIQGIAATRARSEMYELPIIVEAVKQAVAPEHLLAIAEKSDDPQVVLGLLYLARTSDPAWEKLAARLVELQPDQAPIVALLRVVMGPADPPDVEALIARDPNNAYGYYLKANQLYRDDKIDEAIETFRKAASCAEIRLYNEETSAALFKALDVLELQGEPRLYALSWMATRVSNSGIEQVQSAYSNLGELAHQSSSATRETLADALLVLAGQLYRTNFNNRSFADRALQSAFRMKADIAVEKKSPEAYGYAAAARALVSTMMGWPGITGDKSRLEDVVDFVPGRIYFAFHHTQAAQPDDRSGKLDLGVEAEAAYDRAVQNKRETGRKLIGEALADPDEIVGAYLRGIPRKKDEKEPWFSNYTQVERAMSKWPGVFKAAIENEDAMHAVADARRGNPRDENGINMLGIGNEVIACAFKHDNALPPSLEALVEADALKAEDIKSRVTGKPYVYVGANRKLPAKQDERSEYILLYDEDIADGYQQVLIAVPGVLTMSPEDVARRVEAQRQK